MKVKSIQQTGEYQWSQEVVHLAWNPKYDLLAFTTHANDVVLQRLFWKKAWYISARSDECNVRAICWNPKGDCLAIAYSDKTVSLVELEHGDSFYQIIFDDVACSLQWTCVSSTFRDPDCLTPSLYPALAFENVDEKTYRKAVHFQRFSTVNVGDQLDLLFVVFARRISVYARGFVHFFDIDLERLDCQSMPSTIQQVAICDRGNRVCVVTGDESRTTECIVFDTDFIGCSPLLQVTASYAQLFCYAMYTDLVMQQIRQFWEDILLDIDSKFSRFSKEKFALDGGTIGDELMQLLVFGSTSVELEHFLVHDLTDKSIRKLNISFDTLQENIINLLNSKLLTASGALSFYGSQIRDLYLCQSSAKADINVTLWSEVVSAASSLTLKVSELIKVFQKCLSEVGTFLNWLHRCIALISQENLADAARPLSFECVRFLSCFIDAHLARPWSKDARVLTLDYVEQYFVEADLKSPMTYADNRFVSFVANDPELSSNELIFTAHSSHSLAQEQTALKNALCKAVEADSSKLSNCVTVTKPLIRAYDGLPEWGSVSRSLLCWNNGFSAFRLYLLTAASDHGVFPKIVLCDICASLKTQVDDSSTFHVRQFQPNDARLEVVDFDLLSPDALMVLARRREFVETIIGEVRSDDFSGGSDLADAISTSGENTITFNNDSLARLKICPNRKLACAVFHSSTRLKLLEFELESEHDKSRESDCNMAD